MSQGMFEAAEKHKREMLEAEGDRRRTLLEAHYYLYDIVLAYLEAFGVPPRRKSETNFHDDLSEDIPSLWKKVERQLPEEEAQQYRGLFVDAAFLNRILAPSRNYLAFGLEGLAGPDGICSDRFQKLVEEIRDQVVDVGTMLTQLHDHIQAEKRHSQ